MKKIKALRKIQPGGYQVTQLPVDELNKADKAQDDVTAWLLKQAQANHLTFLLAHADDGVIWGEVRGGKLITSHDVFGEPPSPPLRAATLQQARLFGQGAEVLLWRTAQGWRARRVEDVAGEEEQEHYDQSQLLWGNRYVTAKDGFTLVEEGVQGLRHAPPLEVDKSQFKDERHPMRLQVRHYLDPDPETGVLEAALSRLVNVTIHAAPHQNQQEVTS